MQRTARSFDASPSHARSASSLPSLHLAAGHTEPLRPSTTGARSATTATPSAAPRSTLRTWLTRARDHAFRRTFAGLHVYAILFEDSEVDERVLRLDSRSRVLAITGAGCGVAAMMAKAPRSIDAVDINPHHLALTALKVEGPRALPRYGSFYDLLGRGWHPDPEKLLTRVTATLPPWIRAHWQKRPHLFARSVYREGLTAKMFTAFRELAGLDEHWLRWAAALPPHERARAVRETLGPVLRAPFARAWLSSPAQLVALGINHEQRDRILETEGAPDMAAFILGYLERLAHTDIPTNWFVWQAIAGHYDHERQDALPPFLRRDRHAAAAVAETRVRYRNENVFDVLASAPPRSYSHFTLCDAPDWLDDRGQRELLERILRTAEDGAVVLTRSVDDTCMVERAGLAHRFVRRAADSDDATRSDRTRQYRRVDVYEVRA